MYGAVFFICAEYRVDYMDMFLLLLNRAHTGAKAFSVFCSLTLAGNLGVHGELGVDADRTGDPR